jgi:transposase
MISPPKRRFDHLQKLRKFHRGSAECRIQEFLAHGVAPRLHLERLPAYAPELNPGEGLWQQLKGVELRNVCSFTLSHLLTSSGGAARRRETGPAKTALNQKHFSRSKTLAFNVRVSNRT